MKSLTKQFYQLIMRLRKEGHPLWEIDKAYFEAIRHAKSQIAVVTHEIGQGKFVTKRTDALRRAKVFVKPITFLRSILIGLLIASLTISLNGIAHLVTLPPYAHIPAVLALFFVLLTIALKWIL